MQLVIIKRVFPVVPKELFVLIVQEVVSIVSVTDNILLIHHSLVKHLNLLIIN